MANEFTEEELDNLTDEEREAVTGDDEVEAVEVEEAIEQEPEAEPEEKAEEVEAEQEADPEPEAEPEPEPEVEPEPVAAEAVETENEPEPIEVKPAPSDRMVEIDAEINALGEKIEEGEINFVEYNKGLAALNNERQDLVVDMRDERNAVVKRKEDWDQSVDSFMAEDDGHKLILSNPIVQNAFQTALEQVSQGAEAVGKTNSWRLNQAKLLLNESGISLGSAAKPAEKKAPKSRKPSVDIPKTLGDANTAESNDNSEFSSLDGLDGMEFEEALAKLNPAQQERYLEAL